MKRMCFPMPSCKATMPMSAARRIRADVPNLLLVVRVKRCDIEDKDSHDLLTDMTISTVSYRVD